MVIYKYILTISYKSLLANGINIDIVEMPKNANILSCGVDADNNLCIWAAVDSNAEKVNRTIYMAWTGTNIDSFYNGEVSFVGTVKQANFIWHIFAKNE